MRKVALAFGLALSPPPPPPPPPPPGSDMHGTPA